MTSSAPRKEYDPSYGFCLFRIPKNGGRVIWEVTNTCNYGCRYCIFSSTTRQQKDELDTAQVLRVIDELKSCGFTHIKITGGEPFMRPDLMDILRYARHLGMETDISTNAAYITPETARELGALGLEMVHVSLDGHTQEVQETIRGKKTWVPTLGGLKALAQEKIHVRIGCVLYRDNQNALRDIADFCHEAGAAEIIFSLMEPVGRMKKGKQAHLLCDRDVADIKAEITLLARDFNGKIAVKGNFADPVAAGKCGTCPGGEKFLFIDHKGRVSPCTWVSERAPQYIADKTLHTHGLRDILAGDRIVGFRSHVASLSASRLDRCPVQDMPAFSATEKTAALFAGDFGASMAAQPRFSQTGQVYPVTTENLAAAFSGFDLKGRRVLTVAGSGDQVLNACARGAPEVTSFDINILSGYFSALKIAAMQKLEYHDFCAFVLDVQDFKTYDSLRPLLSGDACFFWDKAYAFFGGDGMKLRESALFRPEPGICPPDADKPARAKRNSAHLASEQAYLQAKAALESVRHEHVSCDVRELPQNLTGKAFDFIWLSNISDYAHKIFEGAYLDQYRTKIVEPLLPYLTKGGSLVLGYTYDSLDRGASRARSAINIPEQRRKVFAAPSGITYRETEIPGAIERDNPDTLLIWEAT